MNIDQEIKELKLSVEKINEAIAELELKKENQKTYTKNDVKHFGQIYLSHSRLDWSNNNSFKDFASCEGKSKSEFNELDWIYLSGAGNKTAVNYGFARVYRAPKLNGEGDINYCVDFDTFEKNSHSIQDGLYAVLKYLNGENK